MPEEIETIDSQNDEGTEQEEIHQEDAETREQYTEREKQYYARIKKLENENKLLKEPKDERKEEVKSDLSTKDILYLSKTDIHDEDVEELIEVSQKMQLPIKDAHAFMKPILKERDEKRKTEEATEIKSSRQSNRKDPASILERARTTGQVPDSDEDMRALTLARLQSKMKK